MQDADTHPPAAMLVLLPALSSPRDITPDRTARNQDVSRLLCLPAELRNQMYVYVLGGNDVHFEHSSYRCLDNNTPGLEFETFVRKTGESKGSWSIPGHTLSLLTVCRQTQNEAKALVFESNDFYGDVDSLAAALPAMVTWTDARHMGTVNITLRRKDFVNKYSTPLLGWGFVGLLRLLREISFLRRVNIGVYDYRFEGVSSKDQGLCIHLGEEVKREFDEGSLAHEVVFGITNRWNERTVLT